MLEKKNTILVVDDEPQIHKMLRILLEEEGLKIEEALTAKQAIRMGVSLKPDLILLDLNLPDMDGKDVVITLREWSQVPIIVLSARSDDEEITEALNMGANDYVTKPFNIDVLLARINAALRTSVVREAGEPTLYNGGLCLDLVRHEASLYGKKISFTPKEYDLLRYFMINRGKMLPHKEILKSVWGAVHSDDMAYLRVYIGQIREKIEENPKDPAFIITEPGIGYRMEIFPSIN